MPIVKNKKNDKVLDSIKTWSDKSIHVGVFSEDGGADGVSTAEVAMIQEFGTSTIPSRPFISDSFYESDTVVPYMLSDFLLVQNFNPLLKDIGKMLKDMMEDRLMKSPAYYQANAPMTISIKGFDHPLIHHGNMFNDIDYKIR